MKKGKMFKKSISCLLAALMIIASMPFSTLSASAADSSINCAYNTLISQDGSNRYGDRNYLNIVNDGKSDSFSFAVWQYDLTNAKNLLGTNNMLDSASVTFSKKTVTGQEQPQKLTFYYATKDYATGNSTYKFVSNKLGLTTNGKNGVVNSDFVKDSNGNVYNSEEANGTTRSSYVVNNLGLVPIKEFNSSETNSNSEFTLDLATALQFAINSGNKYFSIVAMLPQSDSTVGKEKWNDLNINSLNPTISFSYSEETFEKTKKYTKSLMQNASSFKKTYSESYIGDTAKSAEYMKGFYKSGTWATQESNTTRITCQANTRLYSNFSVSGPVNAVAIYDTAGKEIRFPVISYNAGGSGTHGVKIQYVTLPSSVNADFSMGENQWLRCSGTNNLTRYSSDDYHNFDSFESTSNYNTHTFYTQETKQWRNYIRYTGSGNTDKYYDEVTNFSWKYSAVYGGNSATYADIPVTYGVYILNLLPLNEILDNCSSKFNQISANDSFYSEDSLTTYYNALQNVLSFDASQYISAGTGDEVKNAAEAVKKAVNDYNNAINNLEYKYTFQKANNADPIIVTAKNANEAYSKKPTNTKTETVKISDEQHTTYTYSWPESPSGYVFTEKKEEVTEYHDFNGKKICTCGYEPDFSAYDNAAGVEYLSIKDNSADYDEDSYKNYETAVLSAASNRNSVHSQTDIDNITFEILYAKAKLKKKTGTVTLMVYDANGNVVSDAGDTFIGDYGDTVTVKPKKTCNIVKWVVETNTAKKEFVGELPNIDLVVTGDATVKAYCDNSASDTENSYTKVIFKGSNGKVSAIKYVKVGEKLKTDTVEKPSLALYTIGEWNVSEVVGSADKAEVTVIAPCEPNTSYQCGIHFAGKGDEVIYKPYDTRIDINDYIQNSNVTYALATDELGKNIIAYIDGTVFYVPARADVYVVKKSAGTKTTMINTVGVYTTTRGTGENAKKTIGFNCKFSLAEGCQALEWGVVFIPIYNKAGGGTKIGTSTVAPIRSLSAQNEYTARINIPATSTSYNSIKAKAYLKYRDEAGEHVIYGNENTQAFDANTRFWEVK
mgnify:CR=1 FL=1